MEAVRFTRSPEETRARFASARREVEQAATQITPEEIIEKGDWLGAGLGGGA